MFAKLASQMGYVELRPEQEEVTLHFVSGNNVFVSFLTRSR